jgi:CRISPR-associated exonuclease Cas4
MKTAFSIIDEEEYPPLSALNDLLFCPRRCFLHRVEGVWRDNAHTLTGSQDHSRVHTQKDSITTSGRTSRGLRLISHSLRVQGVADLVEWMSDGPVPVEYKRGRRRKWDNDDIQVCAQAICLEEMLGVDISVGAVFHIKTKRRREVSIDLDLRSRTVRAAERLHELLTQPVAPLPMLHPKCMQCSVREVCMPELVSAPIEYAKSARSLFVASSE